MNEYPVYDIPVEAAAPKAATKKEFLQLPENKKLRSNIKWAGIISYICAGITLLTILASGNFLSIVDVLLLVGFGLGIHLAQSKVCAILLTIYAAINMIIMLVAMGTFGGWLVLLAGIFGIVYTVQLDKAWKAYQAQ